MDRHLTDDQLGAAARLLRCYHDASARTTLAAGQECVCHNDISPVNAVFVDNWPVALIDFDMASPGPRIRDESYGAFLWLNLGWDGQSPRAQRRRMRLWCDAYGLANRENLVEEIKERVKETVQRREADGDSDAASWWQHQLGWLERHAHRIAP